LREYLLVERILFLILSVGPYVLVSMCFLATILWSIRALSRRCELPFIKNPAFWTFICNSTSILAFAGFMLGVYSVVRLHIHQYGKEDLGGRVMLPIFMWFSPLLLFSLVNWVIGLASVIVLVCQRGPLRKSRMAIASYLLEIVATGLTFFWLYRFLTA